jgi:uncharacterized protein (DUF983 family)
MAWLTVLIWILKCLFTCNHQHAPMSEGKCYCPDCGRGLIYRWVILRCPDCAIRRDSRYLLRQIAPAQRCCAYCGSYELKTETLESPAYFQLHKAQLIAVEDADFLPGHFLWSIASTLTPDSPVAHYFRTTWQKARLLLEPPRPSTEALALLPIRTQA